MSFELVSLHRLGRESHDRSPDTRTRPPPLLRGRRLARLAVFLGLGVAVAVLLIRSDLFDGSPGSNSLEGSGIPATQTRDAPRSKH